MTRSAKLFACGLLLSLAMSATASAADVTGIWMGQIKAEEDEKQDVSFQFKTANNMITGTMFGDEFDLPVGDLKLTGDHIQFTVTNTNYYNGEKVKFTFTGTIRGNQIELTRERVEPVPSPKPDKEKDKNAKNTFTLKRVA